MVQADIITQKMTRALGWINSGAPVFAWPRERFVQETDKRDLAMFYLFLAIQECIDIAAHWVADQRLGAPDDAGSAFALLAEHGVIDSDLANVMRAAASLRNRIAHGYASIDHGRVWADAQVGIVGLQRFLHAVGVAVGLSSAPHTEPH